VGVARAVGLGSTRDNPRRKKRGWEKSGDWVRLAICPHESALGKKKRVPHPEKKRGKGGGPTRESALVKLAEKTRGRKEPNGSNLLAHGVAPGVKKKAQGGRGDCLEEGSLVSVRRNSKVEARHRGEGEAEERENNSTVDKGGVTR